MNQWETDFLRRIQQERLWQKEEASSNDKYGGREKIIQQFIWTADICGRPKEFELREIDLLYLKRSELLILQRGRDDIFYNTLIEADTSDGRCFYIKDS